MCLCVYFFTPDFPAEMLKNAKLKENAACGRTCSGISKSAVHMAGEPLGLHRVDIYCLLVDAWAQVSGCRKHEP